MLLRGKAMFCARPGASRDQLPERMTRPQFRELYEKMRKAFGRNRSRPKQPAEADKGHQARGDTGGSGK